MKNVTMIAAIGKNYELGKDNQLLWHLKGDMKFFKEMTMHKPIIMGRKTLESLPGLLPGRKHLVLTSQNLDLPDQVLVFHSLSSLLQYLCEYPDEVMVIGGASVYQEMLPYSQKMLLTEIDDTKDADSYFPRFNQEDWSREVLFEREENNIKYKHLVYKRK